MQWEGDHRGGDIDGDNGRRDKRFIAAGSDIDSVAVRGNTVVASLSWTMS
jgi:hypothetical protein